MSAPPNPIARVTAIVTGIVQGVNFRWFIQRRASELGLGGYVRNCPDGSVEFVVEGSRDALERLLDAARAGPSSAVVENVQVKWDVPLGEFRHFEIRF
jgi:acylphosphatase